MGLDPDLDLDIALPLEFDRNLDLERDLELDFDPRLVIETASDKLSSSASHSTATSLEPLNDEH